MTTKIAFTSCSRLKPNKPQIGWAEIDAADPDYLFLLGDQIYMDFGKWPFAKEPMYSPRKYSVEKFESVMRSKYEAQWAEPNFKKLVDRMRANGGFDGMWDDHDFAWNNSYGRDTTQPESYHMKEKAEVSRKLFHEFMGTSNNLPEVYHYRDIGDIARVFFLENRSHAMKPNQGDLLGRTQMAFLKDNIHHDKRYTIISTGITLTHSAECWSKWFLEYSDFCNIIKDTPRLLHISGDIHKNAFDGPSTVIDDTYRPCYEIVSSGIDVNRYGIPLPFDLQRNWSMLELDYANVVVKQYAKSKETRYIIDTATWQFKRL